MGMTEDIEDNADEIFERLRQQRDELNLRIHLASMEARDEWDELEKKWDHFVAKSKHVAEEAEPAAKEVGAALALLADEIKAGYQRIKGAIDD